MKKLWLIVALVALGWPSVGLAEYKIVFTPSFSVSTQYVSNVDLNAKGEKSDWNFVATPGIELEVSSRTQGFDILYAPGWSQYLDNSQYDGWRQNATLRAWSELSRRTRIDFTDTYQRTEEPGTSLGVGLTRPSGNFPNYFPSTPSDSTPVFSPTGINGLAPGTDYTLRQGRGFHDSNSAAINVAHALSPTDSVTLGYLYYTLHNEDPAYEDSQQYVPSLSYSHQFGRLWSMSARAELVRGEFQRSSGFDQWTGDLRLTRQFTKFLDGFVDYTHTYMHYDGNIVYNQLSSAIGVNYGGDYQIYNPSLGIDYTLGKNETLTVSVGYFYRQMERGTDNAGLTVDGDLSKTWQFSRRGSFQLSGSTGYGQSYFGAENLGFNTYYQTMGSFDYQLTRELRSTASLAYRVTDYKDQSTFNPTGNREDRAYLASAGFTYDPRLRYLPVSLSVTYSYYKVDSSQAGSSYDDSRIAFEVSLSKVFSRPYRLN